MTRGFYKKGYRVGGDKVEMKNKTVYINDIALVEPYAIYKDKNEMGIAGYGENFDLSPFHAANFCYGRQQR